MIKIEICTSKSYTLQKNRLEIKYRFNNTKSNNIKLNFKSTILVALIFIPLRSQKINDAKKIYRIN